MAAVSDEDVQAELQRLRAENEALKKSGRGGRLAMKVSEKGALSVYGMGLPGDALQGTVAETALDGR
jgi:hypothetical protein